MSCEYSYISSSALATGGGLDMRKEQMSRHLIHRASGLNVVATRAARGPDDWTARLRVEASSLELQRSRRACRTPPHDPTMHE